MTLDYETLCDMYFMHILSMLPHQVPTTSRGKGRGVWINWLANVEINQSNKFLQILYLKLK